MGCKNVHSIVISDTVTDIGVFAFGLCNALQNLTIGNGIKNISKSAFPSKMNLHKFVLAPDSEDETKNKLLLNAIGIEKLARPFLLDALETNGYILKKLKSQIISKRFREEFTPKLIKQNESTAFAKLLSLIKKMPSEEIDSYIEKSQDAVEIRNLLLEYKNRLYPTTCLDKMGEIQTEKDLGLQEKSLADYRKDFKIIKDGDRYKITGYKGEGEIAVVPASIKGSSVLIADKAFENCYQLREIFIENGVKFIGNNAFRNCINLSCITIPDSVTSIGDEAFIGCKSLEMITLPNGINCISNYLFFGCSKLQSVIIPQSVTKIGYYAFRFCEKLQFVSIPDSVTEINDSHPFYKCGGKSIILCSIDSYAHQ